MQRNQSPKKLRTFVKDLQCTLLQPRASIQSEHQARHQKWTQSEPPMLGRVARQVSGFQGLRERHCLTERQANSFSGDGIDRAGSITDQRDIASPDMSECAIPSECSSFSGNRFSASQPHVKTGQCLKTFLQTQIGVVRCQRNADLLAVYGGCITLTMTAPVDLHVVGPGGHAIMPPKRISQASPRRGLKTGPAADAGVRTIGANDPARTNDAAAERNAFSRNACYRSSPQQVRAELGGSFDHEPMQNSAANREATAVRGKASIGRQRRTQKANAAKGVGVGQGRSNPKLLQGGETVRQEAFAAGLVDGRLRAVGYHDAKSSLPRCDRCGQPRGAAAHYENIG